ncbi:hypothetical protein ACUNWD_18770 [Sunxiuqinia sp. A32]|uniref:hypothetical protein n=1 Tax=Sunxiuqinia sp. A32 TaxID=3461496 RepID=UPI0040459C75
MKKKSRLVKTALLISVLVVVLVSSCSQKQDYESLRRTELAKGIRVDSLIYGVHLGMELKSFFDYCFNMNLQGKFKTNEKGTMLLFDLKDGFSFPVYFELFPVIPGRSEAIYSYVGTIGYKNYSHYNKEFSIEKLLKETLAYFEANYKGNDFIKVPNENALLKYKYIKIDGNRQITIDPTFTGQYLNVRFDDLNHFEDEAVK